METIEEWEFINSSLKDQIGIRYNEWHIGLLKNQTTGDWSWINGKPLTFDKWQPEKPEETSSYVLIAKDYPPGFFGSFNSIKKELPRAWICEEQTGIYDLTAKWLFCYLSLCGNDNILCYVTNNNNIHHGQPNMDLLVTWGVHFDVMKVCNHLFWSLTSL